MRLKLEKPLLLISALTLTGGASFQYLHHTEVADVLWFIGGLFGLLPALYWVVRAFRSQQYGADSLAVLSLVGTLATKNYLAAAIISLMLSTGRVLENWAEGQAERQLKALLSRVPKIAHLVSSEKTIKDIDASQVESGNLLLIKSGEIVPVDGVTLELATLDESALTGEPLPVEHQSGSEINSGSLNAGSSFEMQALRPMEESTYSGIIRLVEQAQAESAPVVKLANKWAVRFIPVALGLAIITYLVSGQISRAIAVLVTATPCPLILAVPIAVVSGMSRAAKLGVIIKGGGILELLSTTEVVMFDKTGTLTHGGPVVTAIHHSPGFSANDVLLLAASVDQYSGHVVAKAIVEAAHSRDLPLVPATGITEVHGFGITGLINNESIAVGQFNEMPEWLPTSSPLMVGVSKSDQLIGVIGLQDPIRIEAVEVLTKLKSLGINRTILITGDRLETAQAVADGVGITEVHASVSAENKLRIVQETKASTSGGAIFIGDGVNDAPALAAASVGIAMGARGATAASEAADIVIVEDDISKLISAISIAKLTQKKSIQAAQIGMGLSLVAMLAASFGLLTSSVGAGIQEIIDVCAIGWALTTLRGKIG